MLKRNGYVYTQVVKHCSAKELLSIIKNFADVENATIYSDSWKAYDGLVDFLLRFIRNCKQKEQRLITG